MYETFSNFRKRKAAEKLLVIKSPFTRSNSDTDLYFIGKKQIELTESNTACENLEKQLGNPHYSPNKSKYAKLLSQDKKMLSQFIQSNTSNLRLYGNKRYNEYHPYLFVRDEAQKVSNRKIGLLPLPSKSHRKLKTHDEKKKFKELERSIVMMRRIQYTRKPKDNNKSNGKLIDISYIIRIQRWWKLMLKIIRIQRFYRGRCRKREAKLVSKLSDFLRNFDYFLNKIKAKNAFAYIQNYTKKIRPVMRLSDVSKEIIRFPQKDKNSILTIQSHVRGYCRYKKFNEEYKKIVGMKLLPGEYNQCSFMTKIYSRQKNYGLSLVIIIQRQWKKYVCRKKKIQLQSLMPINIIKTMKFGPNISAKVIQENLRKYLNKLKKEREKYSLEEVQRYKLSKLHSCCSKEVFLIVKKQLGDQIMKKKNEYNENGNNNNDCNNDDYYDYDNSICDGTCHGSCKDGECQGKCHTNQCYTKWARQNDCDGTCHGSCKKGECIGKCHTHQCYAKSALLQNAFIAKSNNCNGTCHGSCKEGECIGKCHSQTCYAKWGSIGLCDGKCHGTCQGLCENKCHIEECYTTWARQNKCDGQCHCDNISKEQGECKGKCHNEKCYTTWGRLNECDGKCHGKCKEQGECKGKCHNERCFAKWKNQGRYLSYLSMCDGKCHGKCKEEEGTGECIGKCHNKTCFGKWIGIGECDGICHDLNSCKEDGECKGKCHSEKCFSKWTRLNACDGTCHGSGSCKEEGECKGKCHNEKCYSKYNCGRYNVCDGTCHGLSSCKEDGECKGKCHNEKCYSKWTRLKACDGTCHSHILCKEDGECKGKCHNEQCYSKYNGGSIYSCNGTCHGLSPCKEDGECTGKCHNEQCYSKYNSSRYNECNGTCHKLSSCQKEEECKGKCHNEQCFAKWKNLSLSKLSKCDGTCHGLKSCKEKGECKGKCHNKKCFSQWTTLGECDGTCHGLSSCKEEGECTGKCHTKECYTNYARQNECNGTCHGNTSCKAQGDCIGKCHTKECFSTWLNQHICDGTCHGDNICISGQCMGKCHNERCYTKWSSYQSHTSHQGLRIWEYKTSCYITKNRLLNSFNSISLIQKNFQKKYLLIIKKCEVLPPFSLCYINKKVITLSMQNIKKFIDQTRDIIKKSYFTKKLKSLRQSHHIQFDKANKKLNDNEIEYITFFQRQYKIRYHAKNKEAIIAPLKLIMFAYVTINRIEGIDVNVIRIQRRFRKYYQLKLKDTNEIGIMKTEMNIVAMVTKEIIIDVYWEMMFVQEMIKNFIYGIEIYKNKNKNMRIYKSNKRYNKNYDPNNKINRLNYLMHNKTLTIDDKGDNELNKDSEEEEEEEIKAIRRGLVKKSTLLSQKTNLAGINSDAYKYPFISECFITIEHIQANEIRIAKIKNVIQHYIDNLSKNMKENKSHISKPLINDCGITKDRLCESVAQINPFNYLHVLSSNEVSSIKRIIPSDNYISIDRIRHYNKQICLIQSYYKTKKCLIPIDDKENYNEISGNKGILFKKNIMQRPEAAADCYKIDGKDRNNIEDDSDQLEEDDTEDKGNDINGQKPKLGNNNKGNNNSKSKWPGNKLNLRFNNSWYISKDYLTNMIPSVILLQRKYKTSLINHVYHKDSSAISYISKIISDYSKNIIYIKQIQRKIHLRSLNKKKENDIAVIFKPIIGISSSFMTKIRTDEDIVNMINITIVSKPIFNINNSFITKEYKDDSNLENDNSILSKSKAVFRPIVAGNICYISKIRHDQNINALMNLSIISKPIYTINNGGYATKVYHNKDSESYNYNPITISKPIANTVNSYITKIRQDYDIKNLLQFTMISKPIIDISNGFITKIRQDYFLNNIMQIGIVSRPIIEFKHSIVTKERHKDYIKNITCIQLKYHKHASIAKEKKIIEDSIEKRIIIPQGYITMEHGMQIKLLDRPILESSSLTKEVFCPPYKIKKAIVFIQSTFKEILIKINDIKKENSKHSCTSTSFEYSGLPKVISKILIKPYTIQKDYKKISSPSNILFISLLHLFATKNSQEYTFSFIKKKGKPTPFSYPFYIHAIERHIKFIKSSNAMESKVKDFIDEIFPSSNIHDIHQQIASLSKAKIKQLYNVNIYHTIEPDLIEYLNAFCNFDKKLNNPAFISERFKQNKINNTNIFGLTRLIDEEYNNLLSGVYCIRCYFPSKKCHCANQDDNDDDLFEGDEPSDYDTPMRGMNDFEYDTTTCKRIFIKRKPKIEEGYEDPLTQMISASDDKQVKKLHIKTSALRGNDITSHKMYDNEERKTNNELSSTHPNDLESIDPNKNIMSQGNTIHDKSIGLYQEYEWKEEDSFGHK